MTLRIGCSQYTAINGDVSANLATITRLAEQAAKDSVALLVLPELGVTGYGQPDMVAAAAEPIPGPISQQLSAIARQHGLAIAGCLAEKDEQTGLKHNTMLLLDENGVEILRYRKVHLWDTEKSWATPGTGFPVAQLQDTQIGLIVCYDTRFPESVRSLAKNGAQLALSCAAWFGPDEEWELALRSRAMDNGIFVAGSVLLGPHFHGVSLIVDPHGKILAQGKLGEESAVTADIDLEVMTNFHERVPLLKHLRPKSYFIRDTEI